MHDNRYIPIFDISIQLNLYRYCITGLVYHDMAIYRYIVTSLVLGNHENFFLNISNNEIIPDENFPDYGI